MDGADFTTMPRGEHDGVQIARCPTCGRPGRTRPRVGGGREYHHVTRPLEPGIAGCHVEIVDWCEVPTATPECEVADLGGHSRRSV